MRSLSLVFERGQVWDCQPPPYPLYFGGAAGHTLPISDLPAPPDRRASEKGLSGDVLSLQLLRRLSLIYCTSIRQQERSYFRHLNCLKPDIIEHRPQSSARLPTTSTRCQNRSAPIVCASLMERDCKNNTIYRDLIGFPQHLTLIKLANFSFFLNFDAKNIKYITDNHHSHVDYPQISVGACASGSNTFSLNTSLCYE